MDLNAAEVAVEALASEVPGMALVVGGAALASVVDAADVSAVTGAVPVAGLAAALAASPLWAAPLLRRRSAIITFMILFMSTLPLHSCTATSAEVRSRKVTKAQPREFPAESCSSWMPFTAP